METRKATEKARLYIARIGNELSLVIARIEGPHEPERIAEAGRKAFIAGFPEDPGPCVVAVAALHAAEERMSGEARVRSPGLHLRMAAEGVKQLRDLPEPPEVFPVAYLVANSYDEVIDLCENLLGVNCSGAPPEPLVCRRDDLVNAFKIAVKGRVDRL